MSRTATDNCIVADRPLNSLRGCHVGGGYMYMDSLNLLWLRK